MFDTAAHTIASANLTLAASQTHIQAEAFFDSGTHIAYVIEGTLAAVALVVGTFATLGKAGKEGAGAGITHQFMVIGLAVTIFLSAGIAAVVTSMVESHGISNPVNVPSPWGGR